MSEEMYRRLRQQTTLVAEMLHDRPGLWRDDAMRDLDLRHLRPHDRASKSLLGSLDGHFTALEDAASLALAVVGGNDVLIETGQVLNSDLAQIASCVKAAHDHAVLSLAGDKSAWAAEMHVMRIVQEANLIGFGGAAFASTHPSSSKEQPNMGILRST